MTHDQDANMASRGEKEREEHLEKVIEFTKLARNLGLFGWQPDTRADADLKERLIDSTQALITSAGTGDIETEIHNATETLREVRDLALVKWKPAFTIDEFEKTYMFAQIDALIGEEPHPDAEPRPEMEQPELPVWMRM
ncbi:hypothetical protein [Salipiger mucosus]|uniref:Uncharacterized protein n=1 Tax=Salipiger mucosus DSM 16094 TaxID=1123237 RepID=S9QTS8_9RHOB|nr:hypothetical protein [Salipiger mucosus]EPX84771.1 hypothetical protein Salmuc_01344 [Salipiger mucosus DSM 16094]